MYSIINFFLKKKKFLKIKSFVLENTKYIIINFFLFFLVLPHLSVSISINCKDIVEKVLLCNYKKFAPSESEKAIKFFYCYLLANVC